MAKLKVFGGMSYPRGKQTRTVIATTSMAKAAEATGNSIGYIREYWSVTANEKEVEEAMKDPGSVVFMPKN